MNVTPHQNQRNSSNSDRTTLGDVTDVTNITTNRQSMDNQSSHDKKFSATTTIETKVARMQDAHNEVHSTIDIVCDSTQDEKKKTQALAILKKHVLPFMETALFSDIPDALKHVSSIPGANYVHKANEAKANQAARALNGRSHKRKSLGLRRIICHEIEEKQNTTKRARTPLPMTRQATPQARNKRKKTPVSIPRRPPPAANNTYTAGECVEHLRDISRPERAALIASWVKAGWLNVAPSAVYRRLQDYRNNEEIKPFKSFGRKRILGDRQLDQIAMCLNGKHGRSFSTKDLKKEMKAQKEREVAAQGRVCLRNASPSRQTVTKYMARLASHGEISITTSTIAKTATRETAENSIISAMALVVAVAAVHYQISTVPQPDTEMRVATETTKGARQLYDLVKSYYGCDVHLRAIKPCYILSTDDTVQYVFEGEGTEAEKFSLVGANSNQGRHTRAIYNLDSSKSNSGLRVKLTYTFSGVGVQAPPFVTVSGLSDDELPAATCPSGILCLEIEGLTVAGAGVTVGSQGKGYMCFIRQNKEEQNVGKRTNFYRDTVLFPFVKELRKSYDGRVEGTPLTEELAGVSWCDGDHDQIQSIITADQQYSDNLLDAMKQNAARTGTEQAADLCRVFPNMKALHKKVTLIDTPVDLNPLKRALVEEFDRLTRSRQLNLPSTKRNALIDFVASIPQNMTRACTTNGILHGFKENGMLDTKTRRYPDFHKMLATCRSDLKQEEYDLCLSSFPILFAEFLQNGHIADTTFIELGFQPDIDRSGNEVHREATGADSESRQRCKLLTHTYQVQLRNEKLAAIEAERVRVQADKIKKIGDTLELNKQCEEKLGVSPDQATLTEFNTCTIPLLKAFVSARLPDAKLSSLKKGTIAKASEGEFNLLRKAFEVRDKMPIESPADLGETDTEDQQQREDNETAVAATVRAIRMDSIQFECKELASELLDDIDWVDEVEKTLIVEGQNYRAEVDDTTKNQANILQKLLLQRLTGHIKRRVSCNRVRQRTAWVFELTAENLARMAALMILQYHTKNDLSCLGEEKTLLAQNANSFMLANSPGMALREGSYLYFDYNDGVHIRSGKVTGRPFTTRHQEHTTKAREGNASLFYRRYPSRELTSVSAVRKGCFETLHQLVAIGYDPQQDDLDESLQRIFVLSPTHLERIMRIKFGYQGESNHATTTKVPTTDERGRDSHEAVTRSCQG